LTLGIGSSITFQTGPARTDVDKLALERWRAWRPAAFRLTGEHNKLGIKKDTVSNWDVANRLPALKVGRLWKFKKAEVDEWIKSGNVNKQREGILEARHAIDANQEISR
jgi:excisionase family DNA binding protein